MNKITNKSNEIYPDFFIIGAAKSGTTTIHKYLCRHPQIFMPNLKETEYYSDNLIYKKGSNWYSNLFLNAKENQLCGEASTTYSRAPHTPNVPIRIFKDSPNAKFIYIMRHPIDRAYSHYCHHMRGGVTMTFEEALKKDNIYLDCSKYIDQIKMYLPYYSRKNFLFLFFDDFIKSPQDFFKKILKFLDLEIIDLLKEGKIYSNAANADQYIRHHTTYKLRKLPLMNFIANNLPSSFKNYFFNLIKKSYYGKKITNNFVLEPMKLSTKDYLLDYFHIPNKELEDFLNIKISSWKKYEIKSKKIKINNEKNF